MDRMEIKRAQISEAVSDLAARGEIHALTVGQIMTLSPACVSADTSVLTLVQLFHAKEFRHVLVTDERGRLVGVASDRDVLCCFEPDRAADKAYLSGLTAGQLMSSEPVTVDPRTPLFTAVRMMLGHGISCLPVVVADALVGILTNTDVQLTLETLLRGRTADAAWPAMTAGLAE